MTNYETYRKILTNTQVKLEKLHQENRKILTVKNARTAKKSIRSIIRTGIKMGV